MNQFWEDLASKSVRKWEKSRDVILLKLVGFASNSVSNQAHKPGSKYQN